MLITNEFIIERYLGSEPLPLLSAPAGLEPSLLLQYNNFISNIYTIYGSQEENGIIPVFFKNIDGSPGSSSSLTELKSGQEYYFISKNSASFPYVIPAIGGTISNPLPPEKCATLSPCCPTVSFPNNSVSLSGSGNIYADISANTSGLIPGRQYSYSYSSLASNWPSTITPLSGTFIPSTSGDSITNIFNFAPTTGNYSGYFPYKLDIYPDKDFSQKNIYSILELRVTGPDNLGCPVMSDTIMVKCNQCIPPKCAVKKPKPVFVGGPKLSVGGNCCAVGVPLAVNISGAEPGRSYNFGFESWPSDISVSPASGISGFGDGNGKIACLVDMAGQTKAIVKCVIEDPESNEHLVDFISIQCSYNCP